MIDPKTVGANIKRIRVEKNLRAVDVAERAGIKKQNLWRIEKNGQNMTLETLCRISEALGVKISELIK